MWLTLQDMIDEKERITIKKVKKNNRDMTLHKIAGDPVSLQDGLFMQFYPHRVDNFLVLLTSRKTIAGGLHF